ncbi:MAG: methyltransferase domain-containing protein [Nannocystales bacterium]
MSPSRTIREESAGVWIDFELDEVILEQRTRYQDLVIAETAAYGRALFLDGMIQSAVSDEMLYHEPLIHPALVVHGNPRRVLVGGAGEGATLREILRHRSVESIVGFDLDGDVIDACRVHLEPWHEGAFDDPKVEIRLQDIREGLVSEAPNSFDAAVLDLTEPVTGGPSVGVLTVPFFEEIARVLTEDGVVVLQAGELSLTDPSGIRSTRSTLAEVFPWVQLVYSFVPSFQATWGFLLASPRPHDLEPADLQARIDGLAGLQVYDVHRHRSMLNPPKLLRETFERPGVVVRS